MKRTALIYGSLAGGIIIGSMILPSLLPGAGVEGWGSAWLGYLIMIVALSIIFVGIKRYRDRELGGVIRFKTAAGLGLAITLVASGVYVGVWEVHLAVTDYAFIHEYADAVLAESRANGMTGSDLQAEVERMERLEAQYANPVFRLPMTFLEIFPVGLLITLVAAGMLRKSDVFPSMS